MRRPIIFLFLVFLSLQAVSQVLECDRYYIFDLRDSSDAFASGVFFRMTTDTNTYNTGYTDLFFVDQNGDTLTTFNNWAYWFPSASGTPGDTIDYVLYFRPGISTFPSGFDGALLARNPTCSIPYTHSSLGINETAQHGIRVYPNPTLDKVRLDIPSGSDPSSIRIFDLMGRERIISLSGDGILDITHLPDGMYVLQLFWTDGSRTIKRIQKGQIAE